MNKLLHLACTADLAAPGASYRPAGYATEGFIHCCWPEQLPGVIDRYYQGRADLVLFELDLILLDSKLVEEDLTGSGECFPHIYGVIPSVAIVQQQPLRLDAAGRVLLPV